MNDCVESLRQLIRLQKKNQGTSPLTEYPVSPADVDNFYASGSDSDRAGKRADEIAFDQLEEIEEEVSPALIPFARLNPAEESKQPGNGIGQENDDSGIAEEEIINQNSASARPVTRKTIGLQRLQDFMSSSSDSDDESCRTLPVVTVRMSKDMPLSTVREEQSQQFMSFSDRIQLVGSLAEKQNESHNEFSAPVLETPNDSSNEE